MLIKHTKPSKTSNDEATSLSSDDNDTGVGMTTASVSVEGATVLDVAGRLDAPVVDGKSSGGSSGHPKFSLVFP